MPRQVCGQLAENRLGEGHGSHRKRYTRWTIGLERTCSVSLRLYDRLVHSCCTVSEYLHMGGKAQAFSSELLGLVTGRGRLPKVSCACRAFSSAPQNTMVCRKSVSFLAEPRRRKGVLRRDANWGWFHSAASMNARPWHSADRLCKI